MDTVLIEIGVDNFPTEYFGLVKRSIRENFLKLMVLSGYYEPEIKVESTKKRFVIYLYNIESKEVLDNPLSKVIYENIYSLLYDIHIPIVSDEDGKETRFISYLNWIQCIINNEILDISSINPTFQKGREVLYSQYDEIKKHLEEEDVLLEKEERISYFAMKAQRLAREIGLNISVEIKLSDLYSNYFDFPEPVLGSFSTKWLDLNENIIRNILIYELNIIPLETENGTLSNYYIYCIERSELVSNPTPHTKVDEVLNEVNTKLQSDLDPSVDHYMDKLKDRPYLNRLGTLYDVTSRLVSISEILGERLDVGEKTVENARKICYFSKIDYCMELSQKFPSLKGVLAMLYAQRRNESKIVFEGLQEYYSPRYSYDRIPCTTSAKIVSICDKLDYICGCLLTDNMKDIKRMRACANGILKTIIESKWFMDLGLLIQDVLYVYTKSLHLTFDYDDIYKKIYYFLRAKLRDELIKDNFPFYIIDGVMEIKGFNIVDIYVKVYALCQIQNSTDKNFLNMLREISLAVKEIDYDMDCAYKNFSNYIHLYIDQRNYVEYFNILWTIKDHIYSDIAILKKKDLESSDFLRAYERLFLLDYYNKQIISLDDIIQF